MDRHCIGLLKSGPFTRGHIRLLDLSVDAFCSVTVAPVWKPKNTWMLYVPAGLPVVFQVAVAGDA